ncbi:MAG: glycosyl hydrolase 115 family protein [Acidobacteriaceae bacterium]
MAAKMNWKNLLASQPGNPAAGCAAALLFILLGACAAAQTSSAAVSGALSLDARLTIVVGADEPGPVHRAANDLASDFAKVLGTRPKIAEQASPGAATVLIGEAAKLPEGMRPENVTDTESFSLAVKGRTVVLAGADMRGTLYAIYQFSQEFLGVDPMYYWTDSEPERKTRVELPPGLDKVYPAPVFKYRGFFINDEDLLTGWAPGAKDHTGIALAVWDKVFETSLRLKANMIVPGTWIFPDDPQIKPAAERGLIVTEHHAIPLGLNVARWPKDVPYNFSTHPEIIERAWKDAVGEYPPNAEILWDVGLRGLSDTSYASMDPSVQGNDALLGQRISSAIEEQMRIVRASHPDAKFVTDLWQEGARLAQEGYLKIPPDVMTVWADDGYGYIQDKGQAAAGQGTYYHVAMMNNRTNQLTEMVPIERIAGELGRFVQAKATNYFLVNTSDIRPYTLTIRAVMDYAWLGHLPGIEKEPADFYRHYAAEEFGEKAAPAIAAMYKDYFAAPARLDPGHQGDPPREYGDQLYHTEGRQLLQTYMIDAPLYGIPGQSPKWTNPRLIGQGYGAGPGFGGREWMSATASREIQRCGDAQARWDAAWKEALAAEALVPASRRPFYQESVLTMVTINRESNRMLLAIAKSVEDAQKGDTAQAQKEAADALAAVGQVRQAQAAAEYGKWKNWYRGDWLTGVYRTQQVLEDYAAFLKDPEAHLPPPIVWNGWEAYYHIMQYEGDRSADVQ